MNLREKLNEMMELYNSIKREVRSRDRNLYGRWKAGGFLVDNDIVSMYPAVEEVIDTLDGDDFDDDEEGEEEDE